MAKIKNPITVISGGSSEVVNGVIERFLAESGTIDANTFVEFVGGMDTDTKLSDDGNSGSKISATALDSTHVFVAHNALGSSTSTGSRLYGVVCTISGTTITAGTDTKLSDTTYGGYEISATALDSTHVFVAHNGEGAGSSSHLYGVVCTVADTTITAGTDKRLTSASYSGYNISATALSATKVFVAHSGENTTSASRLYGVVCTISGTTITAGTNTKLSDTTYGGSYFSATALSATKVFVAHRGEGTTSASRLYGVVCTVADTTITAGTDTKLSDTTYGGSYTSATALSATKVFVAHSGEGTTSASRLYGVVCTVADTTITAGTDTKLSDTTYGGYEISATALDSTHVFVAHNGEGQAATVDGRLYGVVCTISGTTITAGTDTRFSDGTNSGSNTSATALDSTHVFVAHNTGYGALGYHSYGMVWAPFSVAVSSTKINGLTKTACTTSSAGDVWVLNS